MITDRDVNLLLGTSYLKLVLDDFGGSQALAAAAYNAGPNRPRRWREGAGGRAGGLGREHPVQRDARLREEGAVQRRLLCARCSAAGRPSLKARLGRADRPARRRAPAPDTRPAVTTCATMNEHPRPRRHRLRRPRASCERLVERNGGGGGRIIVPTRRLAHGQRAALAADASSWSQADVHDDAQLARLVAQARRGDQPGRHPARQRGASSSACTSSCRGGWRRPAARAGVRRVVHVSALGVGAGRAVELPAQQDRGRGRAAGAPGSTLTMLRPSVIFGADDRFLNLFAALQAAGAVRCRWPAPARRFQPVWVEDVADGDRALPRRRRRPSARSTNAPGPQVYTLSELVRLAGRWSGHERPQIAAARRRWRGCRRLADGAAAGRRR
ncbi:MAG: transglycosylase SLT domain-containing protein [Comamonadaceae bacterium]|nr:transglycosylase SLT domain-containing protein [Comamonadaceae bacterium]